MYTRVCTNMETEMEMGKQIKSYTQSQGQIEFKRKKPEESG